jgi:hypothetical protein
MGIGSRRKEGEHTMKKRILITLAVAAAIAIAIPVGSAQARPLGDSTFGLVSSQTTSSSSSSPIRSEKLDGLSASTQSQSSVVSEKAEGFSLPSSTATVSDSSGTNVDWSAVGVGLGIFGLALLAMYGGVLIMRRRHGALAH